LTIAGLLLALIQLCLIAGVQFALSGGAPLYAKSGSYPLLYGNLCLAVAIWLLFFVGADSVLRARRSRKRATDLEHSFNAARLKALEEQVNPHFLFNCLNSIRGMIAENPVQAQDMVTRLANILRHSLQHSMVSSLTLGEELAIVRDYLELERVRFDERLKLSYEMAPDNLGCRVPPMVLLTLVENALKHGISHLPKGGEIRLRSEAADGWLRLSVANTGGLRTVSTEGTHMGLANLRERLRILHGDKAGLELREISGPCVEALVTLPIRRSESP